ncbi:uncharacterized protein LOC141892713 [Acropora palmata]|uniref:uncharacterized protein LOC141892713 n=1 Tax=Acropora palmata TaxID=6131 RepID=UPI003DA1AEC1
MSGLGRESFRELRQPLLLDSDNSIPEGRYDDEPVFRIGSAESDDYQPGVEVRFITLEDKTVFDKIQSRSGGVARQRVCDGSVRMEASSPVRQILGIKVWVTREKEAAELHKDRNGAVQLQVSYGQQNIDKYSFSVDLDSIYDGPFSPVYELAKVEMDKRNNFQLIVELTFSNGMEEETQLFHSPSFLMRSKPRPQKKRKLSDFEEGEVDSSDHSSSSPDSTSNPSGFAQFQRLRVIEHLEAKQAHIEHLSFVSSSPGDRKADIGYHFKLKDPGVCDDFEEGQVVGFFEDEDGKTSIELLNNSNGKKAFMAGVITRSAYLEATPEIEDDGETDTVCVIGVIKVKCVGSVRAGERIYATVDNQNPGTAIPESHLPPSVMLSRNSVLLGMAMEEKKASKLDDVNMVQCFVCIVLGINDKQITAEIDEMYDHFEWTLTVKLQKERKRFRRMLCISLIIVILVMGLATFFLIQFLYPGSAMRYLLCRRGSLDGTCSFKYVPYRDITQRCLTNGIEFKWDSLQEKLRPELDHVKQLEYTIPDHIRVSGKKHYYLNVDRCAYGGTIKLSGGLNDIANSKQVCGPMIFAVNHNCTRVYYYQEAPNEGWVKYKSVNKYADLFKHLKCEPKEDFH